MWIDAPNLGGKVSRLWHVGCSGTCRGRRCPRQCSLSTQAAGRPSVVEALPLSAIEAPEVARFSTGSASSTVFLGGGLVAGSVSLLGGIQESGRARCCCKRPQAWPDHLAGCCMPAVKSLHIKSACGRTSGGRLARAGQSSALGGDLLGPHFGTSTPASAGYLGFGLHSAGAPRRRRCRARDTTRFATVVLNWFISPRPPVPPS